MHDLTDDESILQRWIGRTQQKTDVIRTQPANLMCALLDRGKKFFIGDELPPLWNWLYFLSTARQSQLGRDGHTKTGDFMPPVSLQRRMWAGGNFDFEKPLYFGECVTRKSTIRDVKIKTGKSGILCFVSLEHTHLVKTEKRFTENQTIVYRDKTSTVQDQPVEIKAPDYAHWSIDVNPDPVMLFRYSALTFNGHRIHYDRNFCVESENYPGLVVHGPLIATLLIDEVISKQPGKKLKRYEYRAISPLFDTSVFTLNGKSSDTMTELWASNDHGNLAMQASLSFCS